MFHVKHLWESDLSNLLSVLIVSRETINWRFRMGKIIAVCNQKGGTGKTTTTVNLSAALSDLGKKVLVVDIDPQGNATSGVGINKNELDLSVYDVLLGRVDVKEVVVLGSSGVDVVPCNINLTGAEVELVGAFSRETRLKKSLEAVRESYDYVFIDSPPSLGLLTLNSLVASDSVLIPIQCEFYALEGVSQLVNTLDLIKEGLNPCLQIEGALLTMADYRTNLTTEVISEIRNYFKDYVYDTVIPRNVRLSEAPSHGKSISQYDRSSIGAIKYKELAEEMLRKTGLDGNVLKGKDLENSRFGVGGESASVSENN
ncbi:Chromosome (plasmid) partitioning protein ParA [hydrothermal vent metagenome]|uniref:Chromosome (Plasmid) partitioning protein ParA n=1 Tax=hydrothermal vent metagenome TaxID=652676 RepID=A0A3B0T7D6_9ZZZZ